MNIRTIAVIATCSMCLTAQQHSYLAPRAGSAIDKATVSLDHEWEDQQGIHFTFTNHYTKPITALLIIVSNLDPSGRQVGQFLRCEDSLVNRISPAPFDPGGQHTLTVGPFRFKTGNSHVAQLAAAVFSDGTASGDPRAIQIVQEERKETAETLSGVIGLLQQDQKSGEAIDAITSQLKVYEQKMRSGASDAYARGIPHLVVGDALGNLRLVNPTQPSGLNQMITRLLSEYARWLALFG
jgi:hypothetical protein